VHRRFSLPLPGSTGQSRLALPTGRLWRALTENRPDLIHTHTFLGIGLEALLAARRLRLPLVGTNHWAVGGFGIYAPLARAACVRVAWRSVARYYNRCDWVSAPSAATLADMRAYGLRRPASVVSNPIDTAQFRPPAPGERQRLKAKHDLPGATVLYAGRLAREKHIDVLIRALPTLRLAIPDAILVLAGHGTARAALQALAQQLGVAAHVRFTGVLDHATLAEHCRAAEVFAIASTSESQSMTLLQAMSAGLPAVGARHGALPEYLPEQAGMLAEPNQPAQFAAMLARILGNPALRQSMSAHAERAAARFAVTAVADAWQDIYARLGRGALPEASADPAWSISCV
jgi:glycosyltransferase involved in cell wall biosynthesis